MLFANFSKQPDWEYLDLSKKQTKMLCDIIDQSPNPRFIPKKIKAIFARIDGPSSSSKDVAEKISDACKCLYTVVQVIGPSQTFAYKNKEVEQVINCHRNINKAINRIFSK